MVAARIAALVVAALAWVSAIPAAAQTIKVGSKNIAEAYIVADIYAEALERAGFKVQRKINLGSTMVVHAALVKGDIDLYPEYTGTALAAVVKGDASGGAQAVYDKVKSFYGTRLGLTLLKPTGIDDGYVMVVRPDTAARYHLDTLSSLAPASGALTAGGAGEFAIRADGVPALTRVYAIRFKAFKSFATQTLRFDSLAHGDIDVVNSNATDWRIADSHLVALADDKHVFPPYFLVPIVRRDTLAANPLIAIVLNRIAPLLTNDKMRLMNAAVERDKQEPADVAHRFLVDNGLAPPDAGRSGSGKADTAPLAWTRSHLPEIGRALVQHLALSLASVAIALVVSLALGIPCARRPRLYAAVLVLATGIFVVPSLALFAVLIPIMGLGTAPALIGLSAYCVLILLRNVVTGLRGVPAEVLDASDGVGFDPWRRLLRIELPLAMPLILAGVRVALVSAVGIATVAAFIDAGGLGVIILAGIEQDYPEKILVGGGLSALMATGFDLSLSWAERRLARWRQA